VEGEPVNDFLALAFGGYESTVPQAGQVRADAWLRLANQSHELTDGALAG
jgi:hypothetical protein